MGVSKHDAALLWRQFIEMVLQKCQISLDGSKWSAQFVRSVGNKAALCLRRALQRGEHLVERLHNLDHLVVSTWPRHALAQVAEACATYRGGGNGARCNYQLREGMQHARCNDPTSDQRSDQRCDSREQEERA